MGRCTDTRKRSKKRYAQKHIKRIPLDVQKEFYAEIKLHADTVREPVNTYIKKAIQMRLDRAHKKDQKFIDIYGIIPYVPKYYHNEIAEVKVSAYHHPKSKDRIRDKSLDKYTVTLKDGRVIVGKNKEGLKKAFSETYQTEMAEKRAKKIQLEDESEPYFVPKPRGRRKRQQNIF